MDTELCGQILGAKKQGVDYGEKIDVKDSHHHHSPMHCDGSTRAHMMKDHSPARARKLTAGLRVRSRKRLRNVRGLLSLRPIVDFVSHDREAGVTVT